MKAPSNENLKEGSQQSARRATSGQQNFERPVVSKRDFSCQEGEVKDGAQQSSGGADQSIESAEWSLVVRALVSRERGW